MKGAVITRSAVMTEVESEREEDEPAALRSAAVEALQSAARQKDPKEFDRLTRYGLALIERARAIGHRRQGAISEAADAVASGSEHRIEEDEGPRHSSKLAARFIAKLWRLGWWRIGQ